MRVMKAKTAVFGGLLLALAAASAIAAPAERMSRKADQTLPFVLTAAVRTGRAPTLDGRLDDACWARAGNAGDFVLFGGKGYATEKTEALTLFDDANLYIGMRCFTRDPAKLKAEVAHRDGAVCTDDCVEIFLLPPASQVLAGFPESSRYFHLAVNSRGVQYDEVGMSAPESWSAAWECRTTVQADRWELEIAVPGAARRAPGGAGQVWGGNFNRGHVGGKEYSGWSITFAGFHDPAHFGRVIFLDDWPRPGTKKLGPVIEARALRTFELEPLLRSTLDRLLEAQDRFRTLLARAKAVPPQVAAAEKEVRNAVAAARGRLRDLQKAAPEKVVSQWEALRAEYARLDRAGEALVARSVLFCGLTEAQLAGQAPVPELFAFAVPAITNHRILPTRLPADAKADAPLALTACPGEYESASFGVYALADAKAVQVAVTDLRGPAASIPADAMDLRVVKVWYQAGRNVGFLNERLLTPELLLKDDRLVRVDVEKQINTLALDRDAMRDAGTLQPVDLAGGTARQFWLTVHVPNGTPAGDYAGSVTVTPAGGAAVSLPLRLRVLPFALVEPKQICSIYYRGVLRADKPACTSEKKTEEQMLAEFRDMVAHGVTNPTVYQAPVGKAPPYDFTLLQRVFDLRRQAGMVGGPLLILGVGAGAPPELLKATTDLAKKNGFSDVYFYAADEASADALRAERAQFAQVHAAGGKVFVAGYDDSFEIVGDLLDMPVFAGAPDPVMAAAYHSVGARILSYANPQGGVEEPETYRRNFGLAMWKAGFDGACTYAYQHSFGHAWDDYDDTVYRDHNMAYPTVNGVIPTVQWEGYREGYDDLRYLATLEELIAQGRERGGTAAEVARKAQLGLLRMKPEQGSLDDLRRQMITDILALRQALGL